MWCRKPTKLLSRLFWLWFDQNFSFRSTCKRMAWRLHQTIPLKSQTDVRPSSVLWSTFLLRILIEWSLVVLQVWRKDIFQQITQKEPVPTVRWLSLTSWSWVFLYVLGSHSRATQPNLSLARSSRYSSSMTLSTIVRCCASGYCSDAHPCTDGWHCDLSLSTRIRCSGWHTFFMGVQRSVSYPWYQS